MHEALVISGGVGYVLVGIFVGAVAAIILSMNVRFGGWRWRVSSLAVGILWPVPIVGLLGYLAWVWFTDGIRELD